MKNIILIISMALFSNSAFADETKPAIVTNTNRYTLVDSKFIYNLKDSLQKDSLLEFNIDKLVYLNLSEEKLDSLLTCIANRKLLTDEGTLYMYCQTHYSYDEENSKLYSGKTYISVTKNNDLFFPSTVIIIFWSKLAYDYPSK